MTKKLILFAIALTTLLITQANSATIGWIPNNSTTTTPQYYSANRHWYQLLPILNTMSWEQCRDSATALGGHLATISDEEENNFISSLGANDRAWLGGCDQSHEADWKWITGDSFWKDGICQSGMYCNWLSGMPDNCGSPGCISENYLEIMLGQDNLPRGFWNDGVNSFPAITSFIVEYEETCGDASGDNIVNVSDAVYLVSYIFANGPAPYPIFAADSNHDSRINISDAVYIIAYIFAGGPAPCAP